MSRPLVQKNAQWELTIDSVTLEGAGVGRVDGFAVFVPGALAGDRVRVHIIKVTASYAIGKLLEVVEPSPHRVAKDETSPYNWHFLSLGTTLLPRQMQLLSLNLQTRGISGGWRTSASSPMRRQLT